MNENLSMPGYAVCQWNKQCFAATSRSALGVSMHQILAEGIIMEWTLNMEVWGRRCVPFGPRRRTPRRLLKELQGGPKRLTNNI